MILKTLFSAIIQRNDFDKYRAFRKLIFQGPSASECLSVSAAVIEPFCKVRRAKLIMAYGSTPYVGMTPKKNSGHIKSAQMTRSKCLHRSVNGFHEPYQALSSTSMGNRTVNLLESIAKVPDRQSLKRAKSSIF